jgi:hypothetical protein
MVFLCIGYIYEWKQLYYFWDIFDASNFLLVTGATTTFSSVIDILKIVILNKLWIQCSIRGIYEIYSMNVYELFKHPIKRHSVQYMIYILISQFLC